MKDYFLNAGIMHLVAVSGLNIAYVILSIMLVLSLFRVPNSIKILISIICVIIYCVFTGSSASVLRASVMGIFALLYGLVERKKEFYNIVGIS